MTEVTDDTIAERLYGDSYKTIKRYVDILANRGVEWGLIGPREVDRLWERHILNSAALESLIPQGSRVADVGSGAGLPGTPLAVLRPDLEMTLVEPMLRRSNFLTEVVDELGLGDRVRLCETGPRMQVFRLTSSCPERLRSWRPLSDGRLACSDRLVVFWH